MRKYHKGRFGQMRGRIAILFVVLLAGFMALPAPLSAANINYQAKLDDPDGAPLQGAHTLFFRIYQGGSAGAAGSGTLVFSESAAVTAADGVVNHPVGSGANLFGGPLSPSMFDAAQPMFLEVAVDIDTNVILPRTALAHVPFAFNSGLLEGLPASAFAPSPHNHDGVYVRRVGSSYVIVETTDSATLNGANLQAAYDIAKALTPHNLAKGDTNRAVVIVSPGRYDMTTGQLVMDTEFVDLVGLSTARDDQYIFGESNGLGTGVLRQTANNVRIENLLVQCTRSSGGIVSNSSDPAAYFPDSGSTDTAVRNCEFRANTGTAHSRSMRTHIDYAGTFNNCTGSVFSFGGNGGTASGTFNNCTGGNDSFGGFGGTASGTFNNCTGSGSSFGGGSGATASGTFTDCRGGNSSFGGLGTASGTFTHCIGATNSFGRSGTASGTFTGCTGGDLSFGSVGTASGTFVNCTAGDSSFGGQGTASGTFKGCKGGQRAFGGRLSGIGVASGTFSECEGAAHSFGGQGGTASGTFAHCIGGDQAFGGLGTTTGGRFFSCRMTGTYTGPFRGRMENCNWAGSFTVGLEGRIYGSTIVGTVDLTSVAAGLTQSRAQSIINDASNVFGATNAAALNIEDPDVQ